MLLKLIMKPFLRCAEALYRIGLNVSQGMYRSGFSKRVRVNAKVISVGNITWGGAGKTPLTILVAEHLSNLGKSVAILTRGYGNDEHHELKDRLRGAPVLVGKNRVKNAREAVSQRGTEYLIMDDGFQHLALERDCDIVAVNSTNPFGNGKLIPAGMLREPVQHLRRADCFVLTKAFLGRQNTVWIRQKIREVNPHAPIFEADHRPVRFLDYRKPRPLPLAMVRGQRVAVLSAIEDPTSFENMMSRLGARVAYAARFQDHHKFTKHDMDEVFKGCRESRARYLVTTVKDSYRLKRLLKPHLRHPTRILILQIDLRMDDEEGFIQKCLNTPLP